MSRSRAERSSEQHFRLVLARWVRPCGKPIFMAEPDQASILDVFDEPWYVIVGIGVVVVAMQIAERRLKVKGRWPYKGENPYVNNMIWMAVLLPIVVIAGLTLNWLR